jgi:hypothetical protein
MTVEIDAPPSTFTCSECNRSGFRRWQLSLFGTPQVCCHACHERARRKQHRHRQLFCAVCSTSFITTRTDALYCSASCKQKAYVERVGGGKAGQRRFAE